MSPHNLYQPKGSFLRSPIAGNKGQPETAYDWIPFGMKIVGRPVVGLSLFVSMTSQEKFIRGKIAVEIVSEMLREAHYYVYRFGYENTLPGLAQRAGAQMEKGTPPRRKISTMPDLVVMNQKGEVDLVEVKHRSAKEDDAVFKEWLRQAVRYWPEAKVLLVHPYEPYFQISTIYDYAKTGKLYPLERDKFLRVNERVTIEYAELVRKYLEP